MNVASVVKQTSMQMTLNECGQNSADGHVRPQKEASEDLVKVRIGEALLWKHDSVLQ